MKKYVAEFVKRGLVAAWCGPVVIAIIFAILGANGTIETLTVQEVCMAIISSTVLAFIAAGISMVYQVEQLPLPMAALIQAGVLYLDYLLVYLMNGWLQNQMVPILTFTVSFAAGYALIWLVIYQVIKRQTQKMNEKLMAQ